MNVSLLVTLLISLATSSLSVLEVSEKMWPFIKRYSNSGSIRFIRQNRDSFWKAGTYKEITIGKSTAVEVLQKWGKPLTSGNYDWDDPFSPKYALYQYDFKEPYNSIVFVEAEIKSGRVTSIQVSPDSLTLKNIIDLYGKDYIEVRYRRCACGKNDAGSLFESPDGNFIYVEYRSIGVAVLTSNRDKVISIDFVDKPIGLRSAKECVKAPNCKPSPKSKRPEKRVL
jgi:hypothetical protein